MITEVSFLQLLKVFIPMEVTPSGIVIDVRPQLQNTFSSMVTMLLGRSIEARLLQPKKDSKPSEVMLLGRDTEVRLLSL